MKFIDSAVLLVMFNKAALSSYSFPSPNVITFIQVVNFSRCLIYECFSKCNCSALNVNLLNFIMTKFLISHCTSFFPFHHVSIDAHSMSLIHDFVPLMLNIYVLCLFQLVFSCLVLYVMKYWKIISFTAGEPQSSSNNPATLVSFNRLAQTFPLALTYLLYMVGIY